MSKPRQSYQLSMSYNIQNTKCTEWRKDTGSYNRKGIKSFINAGPSESQMIFQQSLWKPRSSGKKKNSSSQLTWHNNSNGLHRRLQNTLLKHWGTCILSSYGNFSLVDHVLGSKAKRNKYKKSEVTSCILWDHGWVSWISTATEDTESAQTHGD